MDRQERDKLLARVRRLLALAHRSPYAAEAHAALLKAQELMVRHGLAAADLEEKPNDREVAHTDAFAGGQRTHWRGWLAAVVAENFRCTAYWAHLPNRRYTLRFIGLVYDAHLAREVYKAAAATAEKQSRAYVQARQAARALSRREANLIRNAFLGGWIVGLRDKFREQVEANAWALVLVQPPEVREAVERMNLAKYRGSQPHYGGDRAAALAGYEAGQRFGDAQAQQKESSYLPLREEA